VKCADDRRDDQQQQSGVREVHSGFAEWQDVFEQAFLHGTAAAGNVAGGLHQEAFCQEHDEGVAAKSNKRPGPPKRAALAGIAGRDVDQHIHDAEHGQRCGGGEQHERRAQQALVGGDPLSSDETADQTQRSEGAHASQSPQAARTAVALQHDAGCEPVQHQCRRGERGHDALGIPADLAAAVEVTVAHQDGVDAVIRAAPAHRLAGRDVKTHAIQQRDGGGGRHHPPDLLPAAQCPAHNNDRRRRGAGDADHLQDTCETQCGQLEP